MKQTWQPQGSSDPLSYKCTCSQPGEVLLFYRYFASPPALPRSLEQLASNPTVLSTFHTNLTRSLTLTGKIRIAKEGFNITIGGSKEAVERYIEQCVAHWSFAGLELELGTEEGRRTFFKPSPGCACVFPSGDGVDKEGDGFGGANVRICEEITPMGVSSYAPRDWNIVESLSPAEFHKRLCERLDTNGDRLDMEQVLVDVRNHYESRIGYFVNPSTGEAALRPQVRRFGQWPQFVKAHMSPEVSKFETCSSIPRSTEEASPVTVRATQYITYCTGGIRCEKGSRFLAEKLTSEESSVCTLRGGIQAYLMWMDEEIQAGRKTPKESLFKGKNYVFDARGSTGLTTDSSSGTGDGSDSKVASCHICGKSEDRLSKCRSNGCHLILVVCEGCEENADVRCCGSCLELDRRRFAVQAVEGKLLDKAKPRPICECERERELKLWGNKSERIKSKRSQGKKKWRGKDLVAGMSDLGTKGIKIESIV